MTSETQEETKPDESTVSVAQELATIPSEIEMEVTHLDGSKETVKVRQILISKFTQYALLVSWGHQDQAIEMYCDKPKGWADTLTAKSALAVADKGQEINIDFFKAWSEHQRKWREAFDPNATSKTPETETGQSSAKA